jgi:hypothetical protein
MDTSNKKDAIEKFKKKGLVTMGAGNARHSNFSFFGSAMENVIFTFFGIITNLLFFLFLIRREKIVLSPAHRRKK